jgi:hypothetical protein
MAVKRHVCTSDRVGGEAFSVLVNRETGYRFAFPPSLAVRDPGCRVGVYAMVVPGIPAGAYTYITTIRFQNNLIGRDEYFVLPEIEIEVLP